MKLAAWTLAGALALPLTAAFAAPPGADPRLDASTGATPVWAQWQGRLSLGVTAAPWRLGADAPSSRLSQASLMSDYYFSPSLTGDSLLGGFRATSGLVFGSHAFPTLGQAQLAHGDAFSASRITAPAVAPYMADPYADNATQAYLGFGYTGSAARSGFGFSADFGLIGRSSAYRPSLASPSMDDAIRQMRMTPMLQLGVSYSF